jgi:hypothetical protein
MTVDTPVSNAIRVARIMLIDREISLENSRLLNRFAGLPLPCLSGRAGRDLAHRVF